MKIDENFNFSEEIRKIIYHHNVLKNLDFIQIFENYRFIQILEKFPKVSISVKPLKSLDFSQK